MRRLIHWPFAVACVLVSTQAWAQPTITSITPGYGGAGPNSPTTYTIIGTGFDKKPKWTRFTNAAGQVLFANVDCSAGGGTTCTATGVQPYFVAAGTVSTIQIYARSSLGTSAPIGFTYYGSPTITSLTPSVGPPDVTTPFALNGSAFTSAANGFPGTTSIVFGSTTTDLTSGCATTASCAGSAPSLSSGAPQGAKTVEVRTPGGIARSSWTYGSGSQTPPTPTITGISASTGPAAGGNAFAIYGTNFITGAQTPIGGYGVSSGTSFNFITATGASVAATNVNCPATTRCYVTAPPGAAGPAGLEAYTICNAGAAPCSGNARPSVSQSSGVYRGLYAYAGIKLWPGAAGPVVVSEFGPGSGMNRPATYKVSLYGPPTANVHIDISVAPSVAAVTTPSLDFTPMNWAEPQVVTVIGLDDAFSAPADTAFTIHHAASSADAGYNGVAIDQQGVNVDNETKRVIIMPQVVVTTRAGGTATFTVTLSRLPSRNVIWCDFGVAYVGLLSSDPVALTMIKPSLSFATEPPDDDFTPRTVKVTGHDDGTPGVRRDYTILATAGGDYWATGCPNPTGEGGYALVNPPDVHVINVDAAAPPSGIVLTRTGLDRATVTWNLNAASDFYRIKYSTTPGGAKTLLSSSAMSGQTLTGLASGVQYYFVMSGVNEAGESADSAEVPFVVAPPAPSGAFDSDAKSEMTYYTAAGDWRMLNSAGGYTGSTTVHLGGAGLTPIAGDYDGDQRQDAAIYNPSTGDWTILTSSSGFVSSISVNWGGPGYLPVPGDYDGDGRTDPAVYRLDGQWSALKSSTNYAQSMIVSWGGPGYTPVPGQDFDGDFVADIAVYQRLSGNWYVLQSTTNYSTVLSKGWGGVGYTLVPGDYDGDHKADFGVYQRFTGVWSILLSGTGYTTVLGIAWGGGGYLPVPGDYDGDGRLDLGVFDQATGNWIALRSTSAYTTALGVSAWGTSADRIISSAISIGDDTSRGADMDGDVRADFTVYNPTSGAWSSLTSTSGYTTTVDSTLGGSGFRVLWGDYDGDGKADRAVQLPQDDHVTVQTSSTNFMSTTTVPALAYYNIAVTHLPGDFNGDGKTDIAFYVQVNGYWYMRYSSGTGPGLLQYGGPGYDGVAGDFDGDGKTDLGVYQPSTGLWSILLAAASFTTSIGKNVGGPGWTPVPGDYDGDGKADFVVYNTTTGQWYGLKSQTNYTTTLNVSWGGTGYAPVKGDFDGDGKVDLAVYQASSGNFYVLLSAAGYTTAMSRNLGGAGYVPVPQYP